LILFKVNLLTHLLLGFSTKHAGKVRFRLLRALRSISITSATGTTRAFLSTPIVVTAISPSLWRAILLLSTLVWSSATLTALTALTT
jgi:hypothetical protein